MIQQYGVTNVIAMQYGVQGDSEGYTIEVTDFDVRNEDGEIEEIPSYELNEDLACDINEVLFDYIEHFYVDDKPDYGEIKLQ